MTDVYLNGKYVGSVENPTEFVESALLERRKSSITSNLNILYNKEMDIVEIEAGNTVAHPLIVTLGKIQRQSFFIYILPSLSAREVSFGAVLLCFARTYFEQEPD